MRLIFGSAGLNLVRTEYYRLTVDLESLLIASRTPAKAAEQVRRLIAADIGKNEMGFELQRVGSAIEFSFPVVILVAKRQ